MYMLCTMILLVRTYLIDNASTWTTTARSTGSNIDKATTTIETTTTTTQETSLGPRYVFFSVFFFFWSTDICFTGMLIVWKPQQRRRTQPQIWQVQPTPAWGRMEKGKKRLESCLLGLFFRLFFCSTNICLTGTTLVLKPQQLWRTRRRLQRVQPTPGRAEKRKKKAQETSLGRTYVLFFVFFSSLHMFFFLVFFQLY